MTSIRTDGPATGPGSVALVGAGPGDSELLTLRGAELLGAADVVVADRRMCEPVLHHCRPDAEIVDVADAATDQDVASRLVELAGAGRRVVRLLPGDPFLLGTGAAEADALARAKVSWQLVPGVSAALAVPGVRTRGSTSLRGCARGGGDSYELEPDHPEGPTVLRRAGSTV